MTHPTGPVATVRTTPIIDRKTLDEIVKRVDLRSMSNRESPRSVPCQMPYVTGTHERTACGRAMSSAYDVIAEAHQKASGAKADAMKKSLDILHPSSAERFGNTLQVHWTILGTLHEALLKRASQFPDDPVPKAMLPKVVASITELAVKAGQCKGIADGTYHGDSKTLKLADAVIAAKKLVTECAKKMGGEALLCNIAEAILPKPMKDSIAERLPHLVDVFDKPGSSTDTQQILHRNMMDGLARTLRIHIENGGSESYINAILHLLKLPEYVVQGEQGKAGDKPMKDDAPFDPLRQARDLNGNGAPIAINHAPVTVKTGQSQQPHPSLDLKDLRNLLSDQFKQGYALGDANGYQRAIQEQLTRSEARADRLEKELERLRAWVNGAGLTRNPNESKLETASSSTHSLDLESLDLLDIRPPRQTEVAQRTHQRDTDDKQKNIRTDQRSSLLLERGSGNGNDGTRRAPPGSEDQTDGRSSPPKQPSDPTQPPGGDQLDLTRSDRNLQQKGDDDLPRVKSDTDTNTSSRIKLDRTTRFNGTGTPGTTDDVDREWLNYLAALDIAPAGTPEDPYQPVGPRSLFNSSEAAATRPNRTLSAVDLKQYLAARKLKVAQGEAGRNDRPGNVDFRPKPASDAIPRSAELNRLARLLSGQQWLGRDELRIEPLAPRVTSTPVPSPPLSPVSDASRQAAVLDSLNKVSDTEHPESDRDDEGIEVSEARIMAPETPPLMVAPTEWLNARGLAFGDRERSRSVSVSSDDSSDGYEYGARLIKDSRVSTPRQSHRDRDARAAAVDRLSATSSLFRDLGITSAAFAGDGPESPSAQQLQDASVLRREAVDGAKVSGGQVSRQQSADDVLKTLDTKWGIGNGDVDSGNESPTPLIESRSESPLEAIWKTGIADRPEFASVRATLSKNTLEVLRQAQAASVPKKQRQGAA
ncbi:hypothetical protein [Stenotrophomonas bentonitica]|uniref:hypothetical protein n=1 Tax=Stenotrophomonas bentonitica TaxID=1450134 RepID=UPI00345E06D0